MLWRLARSHGSQRTAVLRPVLRAACAHRGLSIVKPPPITVFDPQAAGNLAASKARVAALYKEHRLHEAHAAAAEHRDQCARVLGASHPAVASALSDLGLVALELGTLESVDESLVYFK